MTWMSPTFLERCWSLRTHTLRAPDKSTGDMDDTETLDGIIQAYIDMMVRTMPVSDERLQSIRAGTQTGEQLTAVKQLVLNGWLGARDLCPRDCRPH